MRLDQEMTQLTAIAEAPRSTSESPRAALGSANNSSPGELIGMALAMADAEPKLPPLLDIDPKKDQIAAARMIGTRMREARGLCNLSLSQAAERLGYANPSKLSKVELATDTNSVPLWLIQRAAQLYEVSIDYLFGLTDDWEPGVPRGTQAWLLDAWEKMRRRDLAQLDRLHHEVVTVATHVTTMVEGGRAAVQAMDTYRARNPLFDESPASSMLLYRIDRLRQLGASTEAAFAKLRIAAPTRHDQSDTAGGFR